MKIVLSVFFILCFSTGIVFLLNRYGFINLEKYTESLIAPSQVTTADTAELSSAPKISKNLNGSLIFGGDVMLARWVEQKASQNGWENLFSDIKDLFDNTNCRISNLESPVKSGKPQTSIGSLVFAAKPDALKSLESIKITAVSLANNHFADQGKAGYEETTKLLNEKKIQHGGTGNTPEEARKPVSVKCGNINVGLIFATYGSNLATDSLFYTNIEEVPEIITKVKKDYDYIVVLPHWGTEYNPIPSPYQKDLAHKYIDAGADLVVGSHPHVLQTIETYKNKVIAYSLGNMVFDQAPSGVKTEGALLKVNISNKKSDFEITPIAIKNYYKPTPASENIDRYLNALGLKELKWSLKN